MAKYHAGRSISPQDADTPLDFDESFDDAVVPVTAMLDVEMGLELANENDDAANDAAKLLDRCLDSTEPLKLWLDCLTSNSSERADVAARIDPRTLRHVFLNGAERALADKLITTDQLSSLIHDRLAIRTFIDLAAFKSGSVVNDALEATTCMIEAEQSLLKVSRPTTATSTDGIGAVKTVEDRPLTDLSLDHDAESQRIVHDRVRDALFPLLERAGVKIPTDTEASVATQLLNQLAGHRALASFRELAQSLDDLRHQFETITALPNASTELARPCHDDITAMAVKSHVPQGRKENAQEDLPIWRDPTDKDERGIKRVFIEPSETPNKAAIFISKTLSELEDSRRSLRAETGKQNEELQLLTPSDQKGSLGRIGDYEIVEKLGSGGYGTVWKAVDSKSSRTVALKFVNPDLLKHKDVRRLFVREARSRSKVKHDYVCGFHSVQQVDRDRRVRELSDRDTDSWPFIAMEFVSGTTLWDRLAAEGPLPVADTLDISNRIAEGIAAVHRQNVVHRDIKPNNIVLSDQGAKLCDFGLVRRSADSARHGTIAFMSPEQARGQTADEATDWFSLGSVIYAMCTGRAPFHAETSAGVIARIADAQAPADQIGSHVPSRLKTIISQLLEKQPKRRLDLSRDVIVRLRELQQARSHQKASTPPSERLNPVRDRHSEVVDASALAIVRSVAPELFHKRASGKYRYQLSFRLWLREQLLEFCQQHLCNAEEWFELEDQRRDVRKAIRGLSRKDIGALVAPQLNEVEKAGAATEPMYEVLGTFGVTQYSLLHSRELLSREFAEGATGQLANEDNFAQVGTIEMDGNQFSDDNMGVTEVLKPARVGASEESELGRLDEYSIREVLGRGGMSIALRAQHTRTGGDVAIKLLLPELTQDDAVVQRFMREMQAIDRLDNQHIVHGRNTGEKAGTHYHVTDYVDGVNLRQLAEYFGELSFSVSAEIIYQAALGLVHAAQKGIVHRDIKSMNLLVTRDGIVKIIDFGLALLGDQRITQHDTSMFAGTGDYMAPEQVDSFDGVDVRADIYSLGATFFELLTGRPPFVMSSYHSKQEMLHDLKNKPRPSVQSKCSDVPDELAEIVDRMLEIDPDKRFGTPEEIRDRLESYADEGGLVAYCQRLPADLKQLRRQSGEGLPSLVRRCISGPDGTDQAARREVNEILATHQNDCAILEDKPVEALLDTVISLYAQGTNESLAQIPILAVSFDEARQKRGIEVTDKKHVDILELLKNGLAAKTVDEALHTLFMRDPHPGSFFRREYVVLLTALRMAQTDQQAALDYLRKQQQDPDLKQCEEINYFLCQLLRKTGDLQKAEMQLEMLAKQLHSKALVDSRYYDLLLNVMRGLAVVQRKRGEFGEAQMQFKRAASDLLPEIANPKSKSHFWFSYGYLLFEWASSFDSNELLVKKIEEAKQKFERSMAADETWVAPRSRIAMVDHMLLQRGVDEIDPRNLCMRYLECYRDCGDKGEEPLTAIVCGLGSLLVEREFLQGKHSNRTADAYYDELVQSVCNVIFAKGPRQCHAFDTECIAGQCADDSTETKLAGLLIAIGKWDDMEYAEFILQQCNEADAERKDDLPRWLKNAEALALRALKSTAGAKDDNNTTWLLERIRNHPANV